MSGRGYVDHIILSYPKRLIHNILGYPRSQMQSAPTSTAVAWFRRAEDCRFEAFHKTAGSDHKCVCHLWFGHLCPKRHPSDDTDRHHTERSQCSYGDAYRNLSWCVA
jgi:hypothetical protein